MQEIADRASISIPYGLEFILIVAALTFVVLVACVLPIMFQLRRWMVRSSASAENEKMKGRVDHLRDEWRRTARPFADLDVRPTTVPTTARSVAALFDALLSRFRHDRFRKEARNV